MDAHLIVGEIVEKMYNPTPLLPAGFLDQLPITQIIQLQTYTTTMKLHILFALLPLALALPNPQHPSPSPTGGCNVETAQACCPSVPVVSNETEFYADCLCSPIPLLLFFLNHPFYEKEC